CNRSTATLKISSEPLADSKIQSLSARRDDSFNPNIPLVSPPVRRNLKFAKVGGLLTILALTANLVCSQSMVTDIWQKLVTDVQASSSSALGAISRNAAKPRLIVQHSRLARGEPAPLGLTIHGPVDGAVVHMNGLARGMELSAGRADGLN